MDIVLLAKFVPDIDRIPPDAWDRERGTLIRSKLEMAFNPLDRVALGMALELKRRRPGTRVVALSMGPPSALAMLREAAAYGADHAVLLTDKRFAGADTIATAYSLAQAIRQMVKSGVVAADFAVFCGMQSPDGDTAQVPAQVAAFLDAPLYPYVCGLDADAVGAQHAVPLLRCLNSVGFQRVATGRRPFVATATRLYPDLPFHVSLAAMRRANETKVLVWGRDDVELDEHRIGLEGSRTRVVKIFEPERKHQARETLVAGHEDFRSRAADLLRALRASLGAKGPETSSHDSEPHRTRNSKLARRGGLETQGSYYRGDCAALCELSDGQLAPVSFEIVSACSRMAKKLGCRSMAVVPGGTDEAAARELQAYGAESVWFVEGMQNSELETRNQNKPQINADFADNEKEEHLRPSASVCGQNEKSETRNSELDVRARARAVLAVLEKLRPQIVVAPATLTGRVIAPYVSAQLDCGLTADCSNVDVADFERGGKVYGNILYQTRPALGGNIMATIVSLYDEAASGRPQMATVRPGALTASKSPSETCEIVRFMLPKQHDNDFGDRITVERREAEEKQIDLGDFEVIVCAGMGVGDRETIARVVEPFRAALERFLGVPVGLGCSRAMVDAGVLSHSHQIGQTGIVVKPRIYFGLGVSGAIQHKIGMENARTIVSINRDPEARMHGFADYAVVGEIGPVLPVLVDSMRLR